jgi:hypothetical protein
MEFKCATLKDAQAWAAKLHFETDRRIQIIFATNTLDKGAVLIPRSHFSASVGAYAIFHFDDIAKSAKLLGAVYEKPAATGSIHVRIRLKDLLSLPFKTAKSASRSFFWQFPI